MRKTKIVCTIGPASESVENLKKLMLAGMNVARINFSHGGYKEQEERINNIKIARKELGLPIALLMDTKGPEIRIGNIGEGKVILEEGNIFTLVYEEVIGDKYKVSISYKNLYNEVKQGSTILVNDGLVELKVERIENKNIICKVINGGAISSKKSINVPGLKLNLPNPTEKDIEDLKYSVVADFDYIAASFVRTAQDVINIKKVLKENNGGHIKVISKIENREGINNFDEILKESDGIMVARGDLGVEVPMEEVPIVQKQFIKKCRALGKPVITATQMLESMVTNPRPTRAEVSDVANAIFDMTSAIMLSAESAVGQYAVECVKTMNKIALATEGSINYWKRFKNNETDLKLLESEFSTNHAMCLAAMNIDAKAIVSYTQKGDTPRILSSFLPKCPIFAITEEEVTYRQLALCWNIHPNLYSHENTVEELLHVGVKDIKVKNNLKTGDNIIIAGGAKVIPEDKNELYNINRVLGGVLKL